MLKVLQYLRPYSRVLDNCAIIRLYEHLTCPIDFLLAGKIGILTDELQLV